MEPSLGLKPRLPQESELFIRKAFFGPIKIFLSALLLSFIFQSSCASPIKSPPQAAKPRVDRIPLFPNGVYIHEVKIQPKQGKARKLKTVVSIQADSIRLVGLSPFNTTLFHMEENRSTGKIVVQNFEPIPDQVKNEFDSFYGILRQLLVLSRHGDAKGQTGDFIVEYNQQQLPALLKSRNFENQILISEYDQFGIPRSLHAIHLKFEALVKISQYELAE